MKRIVHKKMYALVAVATLAVELLAYGAFRYALLRNQYIALQAHEKTMDAMLAISQNNLLQKSGALANAIQNNSDLNQALSAEQRQNGDFASQISELSGTVGTLQKLSNTDPALLEKYSRIYFLNDNYVPSSLTAIDSQYLYEKTKSELILTGVRPFLEDMMNAASESGVDLEIISAYRSFGEQAALKFGYTVTYGSGANSFSADQGYSEHQLGTAVDFTTVKLGASFAKFDGSDGYAWLAANAYKYGFVISYPKGNGYYIYEPWHWRFVGVALATKLHDTNQYFYNLSQQEINQYLISIFD